MKKYIYWNINKYLLKILITIDFIILINMNFDKKLKNLYLSYYLFDKIYMINILLFIFFLISNNLIICDYKKIIINNIIISNYQ